VTAATLPASQESPIKLLDHWKADHTKPQYLRFAKSALMHSNLQATPAPARPPEDSGLIEPLLPLPYPIAPRSEARPSLCVVMPVFNEAEVLPHTCEEITKALDSLNVKWQLLFVNDGSRDATTRILEMLRSREARIGYIVLSRNFGHQAALSAGLDHADADIVVTMDADLQHPPSLLSVLMEAWNEGYDVVHTRKIDTIGLSRWRKVATRIAYRILQRWSGVRIIPQASDYRLLDRHALMAVRALPERTRLHRGLTSWIGFRQCAIPYQAAERVAGHSQYGFRQLFSLFSRAFLDFSHVPLHVGLVIGIAAMAFSLAYLLAIFSWLLFGKSSPPGWATPIAILLVLNSITLVVVGLLGVYLARIYDEVRARPTYIISEIHWAND